MSTEECPHGMGDPDWCSICADRIVHQGCRPMRCPHYHRIDLPWVACLVCKPRPETAGVVLVEAERDPGTASHARGGQCPESP